MRKVHFLQSRLLQRKRCFPVDVKPNFMAVDLQQLGQHISIVAMFPLISIHKLEG